MNINNKFQHTKCFFTDVIIFASGSLNRFLSLIAEMPNSQSCSGLSFPHLVQLIIIVIMLMRIQRFRDVCQVLKMNKKYSILEFQSRINVFFILFCLFLNFE